MEVSSLIFYEKRQSLNVLIYHLPTQVVSIEIAKEIASANYQKCKKIDVTTDRVVLKSSCARWLQKASVAHNKSNGYLIFLLDRTKKVNQWKLNAFW